MVLARNQPASLREEKQTLGGEICKKGTKRSQQVLKKIAFKSWGILKRSPSAIFRYFS